MHRLVHRLDFKLPDFTRLSWVSEKAKEIWEPRLKAISRAWSDIEWLSVLAHVRSCSLTSLSPENFIEASACWANKGLSSLPLQVNGMSRFSYTSTPINPEPGKHILLRIVIGDIESLARFKRAWDTNDYETIGALLGYPTCCQQFFRRVWIDEQCIDTTWPMAVNTNNNVESETKDIELYGSCVANILWRWMGVRAVPHLPCRFDCAETIKFGEKLLHVGRQTGYVDEVEWIEQILSWPVEWSALHGIAEVKTPLIKVSTRTDSTAQKYVVRWKGMGYPIEGATGLQFPYQASARLSITNSNGYQRGLNHRIQPIEKAPQPDWYYSDNGFSSLHMMDLLHEPIVTMARKELNNVQGNIIDLGCGNGVLLKKICEEYEGLVPYGIDMNAKVLEHARQLLPGFAGNFVQGDFFDIELWAHGRRYELAILMVGRLLEVPRERAEQLKTVLKAQCNTVLVYVYPGWSHDRLETVIQKAGLHLRETNGATAGIIVLN